MAAITESVSARSWLFAPGDSERKMEKAAAGAADIVLFDLEDAVAEAEKPGPGPDIRFPRHAAAGPLPALGAHQPAAGAARAG